MRAVVLFPTATDPAIVLCLLAEAFDALAVERECRSGKRATAEGKLVARDPCRAETKRITGEHLDIREQVMRE